nr:MAG TPA: hypothetical protein [Caudoviricetes sp.]
MAAKKMDLQLLSSPLNKCLIHLLFHFLMFILLKPKIVV